jgi:hypothetical protein
MYGFCSVTHLRVRLWYLILSVASSDQIRGIDGLFPFKCGLASKAGLRHLSRNISGSSAKISLSKFFLKMPHNICRDGLRADTSCDRTSQVIRPTYSCPCPTDLTHPCRCTWLLDKFGIWIPYLSQECFTRHVDITIHRRYESAEAITITYLILKVRKSWIITDQKQI